MSDLSEIAELGESLIFTPLSPTRARVRLRASSKEVIPEFTRSLLASGKLSEKKMPVGRGWDLYQDHVCSAAIRVARDTYGLLPLEMVFVEVENDLLDTSTGHLEPSVILSVAIPRTTLDRLNLSTIDPSDALDNFVHRMMFRKTKGFAPVEPIDPADIE